MNPDNSELELYKLITSSIPEFGWIDDDHFYLWIWNFSLYDFIKSIKEILGQHPFEEEGIEAHILEDSVCIDLSVLVDGMDIDLERVFPRHEFTH